jgi:nitrogen fixation/metabolism regulation signal transduction histidine kinase
MRIILYVYAGIYLLFSVSVVVDDIKDKHPLWRTGVDAALCLTALLGMVFYFLEVKNHALILAWGPISLILLVGQMLVNFYERRLILAGKESDVDHRRLTRGTVWATDLFTMFIVLPAIIINLIFAFF